MLESFINFFIFFSKVGKLHNDTKIDSVIIIFEYIKAEGNILKYIRRHVCNGFQKLERKFKKISKRNIEFINKRKCAS